MKRMLLNGRWVSSSETIEIRNPQDNSFIDTVPRATTEDMQAAIAAAVTGAQRAAQLPTHQRMTILRETAERIAKNFDRFAETIACEGIKTIREARKEVTRCIETIRLSAEEARHIHGETIAFDQMPGSENRQGYFSRMPIGIVAAITPFNDPLNLVAHKIGPAIAAGNAIIVKPHEATPLSALLLAEMVQQSEIPDGMLQVITGYGSEIGSTLTTDRRIRMVSFTGSPQTGETIIREAGFKKVSLELGSHCPVIVMNDADLTSAVDATLSGAFWAAGQNCVHVQRILVQDDIYDRFCEDFVTRTAAYRMGDKLDEGTDMGPLINEQLACQVERCVNEAVAEGATLLAGGQRQGNFYTPTVLADVPDSCHLAQNEMFGPVTLLYRFHTLEEAIDQANRLDYGLHAGVFTRDMGTAFKAIKQLHCGGVMINDSSDYRIDAMPFGGVKGSGLGREGVRYAMHEMTEPKVVCFNL